MMFLAFRCDHRVAPSEQANVANRIGEILVRPCFHTLTRLATHIKNRDIHHQPKTAAAVAACLLAPESNDAVLDSGRAGDPVADARIRTGRHIADYEEPKPALASYLIIPYEPHKRDAVITGLVDLAAVLEAVAGYVTIEPNFAMAHRTALAMAYGCEDVWCQSHREDHAQAH